MSAPPSRHSREYWSLSEDIRRLIDKEYFNERRRKEEERRNEARGDGLKYARNHDPLRKKVVVR